MRHRLHTLTIVLLLAVATAVPAARAELEGFERRRIAVPSSAGRESMTRVSSVEHKGQRMEAEATPCGSLGLTKTPSSPER